MPTLNPTLYPLLLTILLVAISFVLSLLKKTKIGKNPLMVLAICMNILFAIVFLALFFILHSSRAMIGAYILLGIASGLTSLGINLAILRIAIIRRRE